MIRQHHSQCDPVKLTSEDDNFTEQSHAAGLEIKNMVRNGGFHFSEKSPMYGDFSELPNLDKLMMSRLRINQVHAGLDPKIKKHLRTPDEMVDILKNGSEDDLRAVGLLAPLPVEEPVSDPTPTPTETPAE